MCLNRWCPTPFYLRTHFHTGRLAWLANAGGKTHTLPYWVNKGRGFHLFAGEHLISHPHHQYGSFFSFTIISCTIIHLIILNCQTLTCNAIGKHRMIGWSLRSHEPWTTLLHVDGIGMMITWSGEEGGGSNSEEALGRYRCSILRVDFTSPPIHCSPSNWNFHCWYCSTCHYCNWAI